MTLYSKKPADLVGKVVTISGWGPVLVLAAERGKYPFLDMLNLKVLGQRGEIEFVCTKLERVHVKEDQ